MQVDLTAKLKDFAAFAQQYVPGDQTRLLYGDPLIFSALANNRLEPRYEISRFLLDRGAVVAGSNSEGDGALSIVLSRKRPNVAQTTELVKDLVARGSRPVPARQQGSDAHAMDRATAAR
ncbi:MAG: ankyrin repeat domain-containing protein [Antricoccus sp.]